MQHEQHFRKNTIHSYKTNFVNCWFRRNVKYVTVVVGEHNLVKKEPSEAILEVSQIYNHKNFSKVSIHILIYSGACRCVG